MTAANTIALCNYGWTVMSMVTLAIIGDWVNIIPFYITFGAVVFAIVSTNIVFLWRQWLEVIRG